MGWDSGLVEEVAAVIRCGLDHSQEGITVPLMALGQGEGSKAYLRASDDWQQEKKMIKLWYLLKD